MAVCGALALTALPTPPSAFADQAKGDTKIVSVTVNDGKPVVLGLTETTVPFSVTARDDSGIGSVEAYAYLGAHDEYAASIARDDEDWRCTGEIITTCSVTALVNPTDGMLNSYAGNGWHIAVGAQGRDGDFVSMDDYGTVTVQRAARLTVNAAPEPVTRGMKLTVTGSLVRADWEKDEYRGYADRAVKLQFRRTGSNVYRTVKTVYTDGYGNLKTTATAWNDGYWRYAFTGTGTTAPVNAKGDYVDVR